MKHVKFCLSKMWSRGWTGLCALGCCLMAGGVSAEDMAEPVPPLSPVAPVVVALVPGAQFPSVSDVSGLRLNLLVGRNRDVFFLDVGTLANLTDGAESGLSLAGLYSRVGSAPGLLQGACAVSGCDKDFSGMQIACLGTYAKGTMVGFQMGALTFAQESSGLQLGFVNRANELSGLQFGIVNWANESEGVQIGIVNVMRDARYPVMPIINFGF